MNLQIGVYLIKTEDKYKFGLYKEVPKGKIFGKQGDGTTLKLIGYYGTLAGALNKLINNEFLESDDLRDVKSILERFNTLETLLNDVFNIKPNNTFELKHKKV